MRPSELLALASRARRAAHAPYSRFAVGAALLASDGRVFTGCNVENASLGLTLCAERVAVVKAVSEGARSFEALAIAGPGRGPISPCGACRQVLAEFAPELRVYWRGASRRVVARSLGRLLPEGFRFRSGPVR